MSKVIIGIHGLANKPEQKVLTNYWKKSITEGLKNVRVQNPRFNFGLLQKLQTPHYYYCITCLTQKYSSDVVNRTSLSSQLKTILLM